MPAGVHLLEVLLHDHGALDQQPGHADRVGVVLLGGLDDRGDRLLDADVDHGVAVVGQDDVDEVLADVVDVALDGREHDRALAGAVGLLHVRFEVGDGGLHHLGRLQHERQLHLARAEQVADRLHAGQQRVVDDLQRPGGSCSASSRSASRPLRSPSMMRRCSRSSSGSAASSSARVAAERLRRRRPRRAPGSAATGRTPLAAGRGRRRS